MYRCPVCRTRRASFTGLLAHARQWDHRAACTCGGYHYPHRPGSPCCEKNPVAHVNTALRAGAELDPLEVAAERAWYAKGHKSTVCPF